MILSVQQILQADDKAPFVQELDVPEWKGSVHLRILSGRQRERFEAAVAKGNETNLRGLFASMVLANPDGTQVFSEAQALALGEKSSKALDRIYKAGIKLNGIGKDGIDDAEKNSDRATSGATPTDSPADTESPTSTSS